MFAPSHILRVGRAIVCAFIFLSSGILPAAAADDLGPKVGATAPDLGQSVDDAGKPQDLGSLMGDKGLVLVFHRSAAWCPYCQQQLIDLNRGIAEIEKRGFRLAALSYDQADVLAKFKSQRDISFSLLSDPKSEVIDRYNLRDPQYGPTSRAYGVPRPIIFVIDPAGTIRGKLFEETYKTRPPLTVILESLDKVAAGQP